MRGKGIFIGQSQPRARSGRKTLKRCKNNGETDDVVLIDVDSDNFHNVIIIDVPESFPKKIRGSSVLIKDKKCPLGTVICIDDDESMENHHPGTGVKSDDNICGEASSSHSQNSADATGDECQFVRENASPVKLSKCKRTYSGKASRNRYGLSAESESGSSDCEFMEDSFGELKEQWEKAYLKRKYDVHNGRSGIGSQTCNSRFCTDTHENVGIQNKSKGQTEGLVCSSSSETSSGEEDQSAFCETVDGNLASTCCDPNRSPFADTDSNSTQKAQFPHSKEDFQERGVSFTEDPSSSNAARQSHKHFEYGGSTVHNEEERSPQEPSLHTSHEEFDKQFNYSKNLCQDRAQVPSAEPCLSNSKPDNETNICHIKASLQDEEASLSRGQHSAEPEDDHARFVLRHEDEKFQQPPSSCYSNIVDESKHGMGSFNENEMSMSGVSSFTDNQPYDEMQFNHNVVLSSDEVGAFPEGTLYDKKSASGKSGISVERFHKEKGNSVPVEPSFSNIPLDGAQLQEEKFGSVEAKETYYEPTLSSQHEDERNDSLHAQEGDATPVVERSIIDEREKLKETDEYKQAIEEEWASRQRELQIQAEEAQQLRRTRKRIKAESMRLLDMERRQKQRLEEIRETQKKDEENMSLKEQLRAEVRNELNKLEVACHDMASLLRGLGIPLSGGLHPLSHEVRVAYKRALLTFHPDRASGSDIRQQVEAEEKFKLISRMKEKFLPTS